MGLKVGIIGLANVGKSTLFNAILGRQAALTAPYPFATVEPNVGVVDVPDERLGKLRDAMFPAASRKVGSNQLKSAKIGLQKNSDKSDSDSADLSAIRSGPPATGQADPTDTLTFPKVPLVFSTVTFVDIAGLVKGAAEGQGLGNQFLGHIRDVDLILHVLRDFDEGIPRAEDSKDPEHDAEIVRTELGLKDLEIEERRKKEEGKRKKEEGGRLGEKPVIYAVNVGEDKLAQIASYQFSVVGSRSNVNQFSVNRSQTDKPKTDEPETENRKQRTDNRIFFCAKLEEEISKMPKNEQKEYLKIYGLENSCLDRIISKCFQALGLISFFTAGPKEVRAWPVRKDSPAPKAAGVIHSDFERLFIRAEIIEWEKLAEAGSWQAAKERGWVRTEGRDYLVKDGEVCNFLIGK